MGNTVSSRFGKLTALVDLRQRRLAYCSHRRAYTMKIFAAKGTSSRIATTKVCSTLHLGNMPAAWHKDDTAGQQLTTKRLRPIQFHVARRQAQRTRLQSSALIRSVLAKPSCGRSNGCTDTKGRPLHPFCHSRNSIHPTLRTTSQRIVTNFISICQLCTCTLRVAGIPSLVSLVSGDH